MNFTFYKKDPTYLVGTHDKDDLSDLPQFMQDDLCLVKSEEFLKDCNTDEEKIEKVLSAAHLYYDNYFDHEGNFVIEIEWGDWKHDHLFCDHLMEALGYSVVSESLTDEDGSDCYSAIHTYRKAA